MGRRFATGLVLGMLCGVAMVGCTLLDQATTDVPLINVPNSVARFPQNDGPGLPNVLGKAASQGVSGGPGAGSAPLFANNPNGIQIFLGCPGDTAVDGSIVPDYNCSDFTSVTQVTQFFQLLNQRVPGNADCHGLDSNGSGTPCDLSGLPAALGGAGTN